MRNAAACSAASRFIVPQDMRTGGEVVGPALFYVGSQSRSRLATCGCGTASICSQGIPSWGSLPRRGERLAVLSMHSSDRDGFSAGRWKRAGTGSSVRH
jgi:hypothetical protein